MDKVSQKAREAAAEFYNAHLARPGEVPVAAAMRAGHIDDSALVQAFARFEADIRAEMVGEATSLVTAIDDFFAPWGSWKTVWWEDFGGDGEFTPENMLRALRKRLDQIALGKDPA